MPVVFAEAKRCPHCGVTAFNDVQLEHLFGVRLRSYAQSWCRACRAGPCGRGTLPTCRCKRRSLELQAARLEGIDLEAIVRDLGLDSRNKGRYGIAVESLLGLKTGDNRPRPDWRGKVEVKTTSLVFGRKGWRAKDKQFVCAEGLDPIVKLRDVLWVFLRYEDKIVMGSKRRRLRGTEKGRLQLDLDGGGGRYLFLNTHYPSGASRRFSWYLHKDYFTDFGILHAFADP